MGKDEIGMLAIRRAATAVYEAGEVARRMRSGIRDAMRFDEKGPKNLVTDADMAVERRLHDSLLSITPGAGFLSEEGICEASANDGRWVVDPIDGTGNYLSGMPYALSVAYQERGQTVLGMVYEPETGRLLWAHRGHQAFLVRNLGEIMPCYIENMVGGGWLGRPIERTTEADVAIVGMPYDRNRTADALEVAGRLHALFGDVKRIGPASLDICRVALGDASVYAEYDLEPWDYTAAELIAKEAGCVFERRGALTVCGSQRAVTALDGNRAERPE